MLGRKTKAREKKVVEESRAALAALTILAVSLEDWVDELCENLEAIKEAKQENQQ